MNDNEWKEYLRKQQENFTEYQRLYEERQRESEARRLKSEALINQTREALLRTIEHQNRAKKTSGSNQPLRVCVHPRSRAIPLWRNQSIGIRYGHKPARPWKSLTRCILFSGIKQMKSPEKEEDHPDGWSESSISTGLNGGADGTRTRDLRRDRPAF